MGGAGPFQWMPDLKRWYPADRDRKLRDKKEIFFTLARPTRQPGKYKVIWDGKDDHKKLLPAGEYTIWIEAAREHGTYQSIRKKVTLADKPFTEELKGNVEIRSASIEYRRKAPRKVARRRPIARRTAGRWGRRLKIRLVRLMLWLHIYVSMFGLAAVLFFSVTGITLNHPDWFFGSAERQDQAEGQVDRKWLQWGRRHRPATTPNPPASPIRPTRSPSWRSSSICGRRTRSAARWPTSGSTTSECTGDLQRARLRRRRLHRPRVGAL